MTSRNQNPSEQRKPVTARDLRKAKEKKDRKKNKGDQDIGKPMETESLHNQEPEREAVPFSPVSEELRQEGLEPEPPEETVAFNHLQEEWLKELDEWKTKAKENEERFMKARADLENFRRRARKDQEETAKYAAASLVESLLPILDNFERALEAGATTEESKALHQGVEMIYRQFFQVLQDKGLSAIEAEGTPFNPHEHNAVMQETKEGVESGIVIQELQKGYRFKERVIRPSMVKVSS
ncbi:nucleotide exchange factor GrpE [Kroppenstedtia pulmonis]|uniref:Protein GrpE n=1 Tax=Kroppenstedtia pulmonis TaxID=1380685 RepID=A0A7D3XJM4_9BACL|nr:nucleotide exchange factor GrpE [Kroppenstedtia pulmonis]QKG84959.1 nucleotide exchange factor GrpE [Kroppenstedtia pulmonis]